jgi:ribonuclease P protein subunit RPR2
MAKGKATTVPNKILHTRISYLYQAASYLATQQQHSQASQDKQQIERNESLYVPAANLLVSDLKSVSLKAQIRMSPAMKQSICKSCNTILIDGSTCSSELENTSRGGKKPWADVLVRRCNICGTSKRYPSATRQKRRPHRPANLSGSTEDTPVIEKT